MECTGFRTRKKLCAKVSHLDKAMQREVKITARGQVIVPRDIRHVLGVRPGDTLLFENDEAGVRVRPVRRASPFEKYRGIGNPGIPSGRKAVMRWLRDSRGQ